MNIDAGARAVKWVEEPKLLIADDDRAFRESLGEVFSRRGYATRLAADGLEALEIVHQHGPLHLILLDIHMPRLTGLEALQRLRGDGFQSMPCILMSAMLSDELVQVARNLDTAAVLSKPFSIAALTQTVESTLRLSYGWQH